MDVQYIFSFNCPMFRAFCTVFQLSHCLYCNFPSLLLSILKTKGNTVRNNATSLSTMLRGCRKQWMAKGGSGMAPVEGATTTLIVGV